MTFSRGLDDKRFKELLNLVKKGCSARQLSPNLSLLHKTSQSDREALAETLTSIPLPSVYLVWFNFSIRP